MYRWKGWCRGACIGGRGGVGVHVYLGGRGSIWVHVYLGGRVGVPVTPSQVNTVVDPGLPPSPLPGMVHNYDDDGLGTTEWHNDEYIMDWGPTSPLNIDGKYNIYDLQEIGKQVILLVLSTVFRQSTLFCDLKVAKTPKLLPYHTPTSSSSIVSSMNIHMHVIIAYSQVPEIWPFRKEPFPVLPQGATSLSSSIT